MAGQTETRTTAKVDTKYGIRKKAKSFGLAENMVDEETKWIVEKIFSLAYQGYGSAKITKILREEKVPTASWLNFTRYGTSAHIFEGKPESKRYEWTIAHVKAILKSEVYIGNSVHNRQSTVSFKSKKKVRKPESA